MYFLHIFQWEFINKNNIALNCFTNSFHSLFLIFFLYIFLVYINFKKIIIKKSEIVFFQIYNNI